MIILQAQDLEKRFNGEPIFSKVNLTIQDKSRVALVGRNGAGKSTLVKMIIGQIPIDQGKVIKKRGLTIGYLAQDTGLSSQKSIYDEMESVFASLKKTELRLHDLEKEISEINGSSNPEHFKELSNSYDKLRASFEQQNGYGYEAEIRGVLHGFGFGEADYPRKINELSGGQKTQLALAKLLLEKPELLILDEPTNHLDIATVTWLEGYIQNYSGSLLIISHDRYFLDRIVNEVYDLAEGTLTHYNGNYTKYVEQKSENFVIQQKAYEKQQKKINKLQTFVDKNIVRASTTKQAQSRRKQLEKMTKLQRPNDNKKVARFSFTPEHKSGNNVLKVSNAAIGYDHVLAQPVNIEIKKHQAFAIVGPNGVGKSTLLKSILGIIPLIDGKIEWGTGVDTGYYDQEQATLHNSKTVLNELWDDHPTTAEGDIRTILGSFLFSGDDVTKTVSELSGGEKARLLLTKLAMQHNNFLLLDEPTNHLDIDSREVLETALNQFDGTILFVSHDRYFINQVATSVVELSKKGTAMYLGDYDYYIAKKEEQEAIKAHEASQNDSTDLKNKEKGLSTGQKSFQQNKQQQKDQRKITRQLDKLERDLDEFSKQKELIENQMTLPESFNNVAKMTDLQNKLNKVEKQISETESQWEQLSINLENLEK